MATIRNTRNVHMVNGYESNRHQMWGPVEFSKLLPVGTEKILISTLQQFKKKSGQVSNALLYSYSQTYGKSCIKFSILIATYTKLFIKKTYGKLCVEFFNYRYKYNQFYEFSTIKLLLILTYFLSINSSKKGHTGGRLTNKDYIYGSPKQKDWETLFLKMFLEQNKIKINNYNVFGGAHYLFEDLTKIK
ncbi:hypothetical protein AGLY_014126 [Aphis glycines]|uniref:Uncharacterized protein n=1 Tax=Aphis glycines TaxID=307491 RepID=A0A6G0T4U6_APHGL|nr:hypothetical protein AGLY_014126 [Aphis glycines]